LGTAKITKDYNSCKPLNLNPSKESAFKCKGENNSSIKSPLSLLEDQARSAFFLASQGDLNPCYRHARAVPLLSLTDCLKICYYYLRVLEVFVVDEATKIFDLCGLL
jgi:hypothetical protein